MEALELLLHLVRSRRDDIATVTDHHHRDRHETRRHLGAGRRCRDKGGLHQLGSGRAGNSPPSHDLLLLLLLLGME